MTALRDFLHRFRRAGAPGAAVPGGGVPADRSAELSAELQPSLALLAGTEEQARLIRAEAERDAERIRRESRQRAEEIVLRAQEHAPRARAAAAEAAGDEAAAEEARIREAAVRRTAAIRARALDRMPAVLSRVCRRIVEELESPQTPLREAREPERAGGSP